MRIRIFIYLLCAFAVGLWGWETYQDREARVKAQAKWWSYQDRPCFGHGNGLPDQFVHISPFSHDIVISNRTIPEGSNLIIEDSTFERGAKVIIRNNIFYADGTNPSILWEKEKGP